MRMEGTGARRLRERETWRLRRVRRGKRRRKRILMHRIAVESLFEFCLRRNWDIKAGEAVVVEQAVAFVPRSQDRTAVCHECCRDLHEDGRSVECPGCKRAVYCQNCEESAMPSHSKWCKVLQQI